jgi:hypothetical protein
MGGNWRIPWEGILSLNLQLEILIHSVLFSIFVAIIANTIYAILYI